MKASRDIDNSTSPASSYTHLLMKFFMKYPPELPDYEGESMELPEEIQYVVGHIMVECLKFMEGWLSDSNQPSVFPDGMAIEDVVFGEEYQCIFNLCTDRYIGEFYYPEMRRIIRWIKSMDPDLDVDGYTINSVVYGFLLETVKQYVAKDVYSEEYVLATRMSGDSLTINRFMQINKIEEIMSLISRANDISKSLDGYTLVVNMFSEIRCTPFGATWEVSTAPLTDEEKKELQVLPVVHDFFNFLKNESDVSKDLGYELLKKREVNLFGAACMLFSVKKMFDERGPYPAVDFEVWKTETLYEECKRISYGFDPYYRMDI